MTRTVNSLAYGERPVQPQLRLRKIAGGAQKSPQGCRGGGQARALGVTLRPEDRNRPARQRHALAVVANVLRQHRHAVEERRDSRVVLAAEFLPDAQRTLVKPARFFILRLCPFAGAEISERAG